MEIMSHLMQDTLTALTGCFTHRVWSRDTAGPSFCCLTSHLTLLPGNHTHKDWQIHSWATSHVNTELSQSVLPLSIGLEQNQYSLWSQPLFVLLTLLYSLLIYHISLFCYWCFPLYTIHYCTLCCYKAANFPAVGGEGLSFLFFSFLK